MKIAKNKSLDDIPPNLTLNGNTIINVNRAEGFAAHFHEKTARLIDSCDTKSNVYNGLNKLLVVDRFFREEADIRECLQPLKPKMCEGYDRIPTRVIYDAREILTPTLKSLFRKIYDQNVVPDQWKIAQINPIHKKGNRNEIKNYRPISNLCCTSKVFEYLILRQIHYLETTNLLDFTGKQQHGFKKIKAL